MSIPPPRFRVARPGYETASVDAFIDRLSRALEARPVRMSTEDVRSARFPLAATKPGYAVADVDAWIGHVVASLSSAEAQQRSQHATTHTFPTPMSTQASRTLPLVSGLRRRSQPPAAPDPGRSAVQELPASPMWVKITAMLLIVGMVGLFVLSYFF